MALPLSDDSLLLQDAQRLSFVCGCYGNAIERIGKRWVAPANLQKSLLIHAQNNPQASCFENRQQHIGQIHRANPFLKEQLSIIQTNDDIFGSICLTKDAHNKVLELTSAWRRSDE